jgi:hypothetical protein
MLATLSTQLGRALQPCFMMSRNKSAVVDASTVTSFSSGAGGGAALPQSAMMSVATAGAARSVLRATTPPRAVMSFAMCMESSQDSQMNV